MSDYQFSLRKLLIAMFLVAVLIAFAAPTVREWSPAAQWMLAKWLAIYAVMAAAFTTPLVLLHRHTCRRAGQRLLTPLDGNHLLGRMYGFSQAVFVILFLFLTLSDCQQIVELRAQGVAPSSATDSHRLLVGALIAMFFATMIGAWAGVARWHLCENGIQIGLRLLPWSEFTRFEWKKIVPHHAIVYRNCTSFEIRASREQQAQLAEILEQYIGKSPQPAVS